MRWQFEIHLWHFHPASVFIWPDLGVADCIVWLAKETAPVVRWAYARAPPCKRCLQVVYERTATGEITHYRSLFVGWFATDHHNHAVRAHKALCVPLKRWKKSKTEKQLDDENDAPKWPNWKTERIGYRKGKMIKAGGMRKRSKIRAYRKWKQAWLRE